MADTDICRVCSLDGEGRDGRCSSCLCVERDEVKRDADRSHKVMAKAAATLELGIDGGIPREQAYTDAFLILYSHLYGEGDALRVLAEGKRNVG